MGIETVKAVLKSVLEFILVKIKNGPNSLIKSLYDLMHKNKPYYKNHVTIDKVDLLPKSASPLCIPLRA